MTINTLEDNQKHLHENYFVFDPIEGSEDVIMTITETIDTVYAEKVFPIFEPEISTSTRKIEPDGRIEYQFRASKERASKIESIFNGTYFNFLYN